MLVTFLGHQGWAFQKDSTSPVVLLDPVEEHMGNGIGRLPVFPRRRLSFEGSAIAAIFLSHEHSDHFDIETLARFSPGQRTYLPNLTSQAIRSTLSRLGHDWQLLRAFAPIEIAGLAITPLPIVNNPLERDVLAFLVQSPDGSFLTSVDGRLHQSAIDWLRTACPERTLDNYTNNYIQQLPELSNYPALNGRAMHAASMTDFVAELSPRRVLISGQGWCFEGDRAELNARFFTLDNSFCRDLASSLYPDAAWHVAAPGETFDTTASEPLLGGKKQFLAWEERQSKRVHCDRSSLAPLQWSCWVGTPTIPAVDFALVEAFVTEQFGLLLASCGQELISAIYELESVPDRRDYQHTLILGVRNGDSSFYFSFDLGLMRFIRVQIAKVPELSSMMGASIWAADLLALINGREEAFLIYESSVLHWNNALAYYGLPVTIDLFGGFCPRFLPAIYEEAYTARLKRVLEATPPEAAPRGMTA
jgi:hypothetical protein